MIANLTWFIGVWALLEIYLIVRLAFVNWDDMIEAPQGYKDMRPHLYEEFSKEEMARRERDFKEAYAQSSQSD